jgi:hypothetical protein
LSANREVRDNHLVVELSVAGGQVWIKVLGWSKVWALKSHLEVPLIYLRDARIGGDLPKGFWIRLPGTDVPGLIKAGSYTNGRGRWSFWDIRRSRDRTLVIELSDWKYDFIVVEVEDPAAAMEMLRQALQTARSMRL